MGRTIRKNIDTSIVSNKEYDKFETIKKQNLIAKMRKDRNYRRIPKENKNYSRNNTN